MGNKEHAQQRIACHTQNWKATVVVASHIKDTKQHEKHLCADKNHVQLEVEQSPSWKSM